MFTIKQISSTAIIAAASLFSLPHDTIAQTHSKGVKNIVLVHGAFADGSSYA
jgi:hypothetical protein